MRILREGVWVAASQLGAALAGLVGVRILTELLSPERYGQMAVALGLVVLGSNVCVMPPVQALLRFFPEAAKLGKVETFRAMVAHDVTRAAVASACLVISGGLLVRWVGTGSAPYSALIAAVCLVTAEAWRLLEVNLLTAARRQATFAVRSAGDAWVRLAFGGGAAVAIAPLPAAVLGGYAAGSAVVSWVTRHRVVRGGGDPDWRSDPWCVAMRVAYLRFALPLFPQAVLAWVRSLGDRYVLVALAGAAEAGVYVAAYGLASQPFILASSFATTTLRPVLYDAVARGDRRKERRAILASLGISLSVGLVGVAAFTWLAPWIVGLFLGPQFRGPAVRLFPWIAAAYALQGTQETLELMLLAHRRSGRLLALHVAAAVASLVLFAVWIPGRGAIGAAQATFASFTIALIAAVVLSIGIEGRPGSP